MRRQPTHRAPHTQCAARTMCPDAAHAGEARILHSAVVLLFELLPRPGRPQQTCGRGTLVSDGDVEVCCFQEDFACLARWPTRAAGLRRVGLYPLSGEGLLHNSEAALP